MLTISKGNTKLGKIPNISLRPVADCANCSECKKDCYAVKAFRLYPATKRAWTGNSEAFRTNLSEAITDTKAWLQYNKPQFFRIHVAGDFLTQQHINGWIHITKEFPQTKFLAFTKRFDLDFSKAPKNFSVIFSQWSGMPDFAPKGARRAWVEDGKENRIPKDALHCPGKCDTCYICWSLGEIGKDIIFHKH